MEQPLQSDVELMNWGASDEGRRAIASILPEISVATVEPRQVAELRKRFTQAQTGWLLKQLELLSRAAVKFPFANEMLLTPVGYEQADDWLVARYKAARLAAASATQAVDLGCGIGGFCMALSRVLPTIGYELDPVTAIAADHQLRMIKSHLAGPAGSSIRQADAGDWVTDARTAWHVDPDRRASGKRVTHWQAFVPTAEKIRSWRDAGGPGAIKVAPATSLFPYALSGEQREWIGSRRECRQQVVWCNQPKLEGKHRATVVRVLGVDERTTASEWTTRIADPWGEIVAASFTGEPDIVIEVVPSWRRLVIDPDPTLWAAGLVGAAAACWGWRVIDPTVGYLTTDNAVTHPLWQTLQIVEELPWRKDVVRNELRSRGYGRITVKQRGADLDVNRLQVELSEHSLERAATVLLYRQGRGIRALIAENYTPCV